MTPIFKDVTPIFNHFWAGSVVEWVYKNVGGLNLDGAKPGYGNILLQPKMWGGISNAVLNFNSVRGPITSSWFWTNSQTTTNLSMQVSIPANVLATVSIPSTNIAMITEGGLSATNAEGVSHYEVQATNGTTLFKLGSGTYNFVAPRITF